METSVAWQDYQEGAAEGQGLHFHGLVTAKYARIKMRMTRLKMETSMAWQDYHEQTTGGQRLHFHGLVTAK